MEIIEEDFEKALLSVAKAAELDPRYSYLPSVIRFAQIVPNDRSTAFKRFLDSENEHSDGARAEFLFLSLIAISIDPNQTSLVLPRVEEYLSKEDISSTFKALIEFRKSNYEQVIRHLSEFEKIDDNRRTLTEDGYPLCLLAMAHKSLGSVEKSKRYLSAFDSLIAENLGDFRVGNESWVIDVFLPILHQETLDRVNTESGK